MIHKHQKLFRQEEVGGAGEAAAGEDFVCRVIITGDSSCAQSLLNIPVLPTGSLTFECKTVFYSFLIPAGMTIQLSALNAIQQEIQVYM